MNEETAMPQHDDESEDVNAEATERMDVVDGVNAGGRTDTADGRSPADGAGTSDTAERAGSAGSGESTDATSPTEVIEPAASATPTSAAEAATVPTESIDSVLGASTGTGSGFTDATHGSTGPAGSYTATTPTAHYGTSSTTGSSSGVPYGAFSGGAFSGTASPEAASWDPAVSRRPRVRVGAIVWGVLVVAFAATVIAISASPDARYAFDAWQASLTPVAWAVMGVVALGVAVLLIAGTSAIRGAQRRARTRDRT